jgi:hypothetical protein
MELIIYKIKGWLLHFQGLAIHYWLTISVGDVLLKNTLNSPQKSCLKWLWGVFNI